MVARPPSPRKEVLPKAAQRLCFFPSPHCRSQCQLCWRAPALRRPHGTAIVAKSPPTTQRPFRAKSPLSLALYPLPLPSIPCPCPLSLALSLALYPFPSILAPPQLHSFPPAAKPSE